METKLEEETELQATLEKETASQATAQLPIGPNSEAVDTTPKWKMAMLRSVLGDSLEDIAKDLGMSQKVIYAVLNAPMAAEEMRKMAAVLAEHVKDSTDGTEAEKQLAGGEVLAAKQLVTEIENGEKSSDRISAAAKLLDMRGFNKKTIEVEHRHVVEVPAEVMDRVGQTLDMMRLKEATVLRIGNGTDERPNPQHEVSGGE